MDQAVLNRNRAVDYWAKKLISLGGVAILVCVIGMLVMLLKQTAPLFLSPDKKELTAFALPNGKNAPEAVALGVDEYLETGYWIDQTGTIRFLDLKRGVETDRQELFAGLGITKMRTYGPNSFSLTFADGSAGLVEITFAPHFDENNLRTIEHQTKVLRLLPAGSFPEVPLEVLIRPLENNGLAAVALMPDNRVQVMTQLVEENFLGASETKTYQTPIQTDPKDLVTALALSQKGNKLYLATQSGKLIFWNLGNPEEPALVDMRTAFADRRALTSLALVYGDESLAVGDEKGQVTAWFMAPESSGSPQKRLTLIHRLSKHNTEIQSLVPSLRNKSVLSLADGAVTLDHMTSERELVRFSASAPLKHFAFSTRGNGLLGLDQSNQLTLWTFDAPHPEGSWQVYFGKVHYENYNAPDYVWQSSAGTDDFEPKFSLVPLIFGSLKGTLYAMLFAVPMGIFGAIYTNQFASRRFQTWVKPAVEITAAVPSVIIGFLAALWLAPILDRWLLGFFLFLLILPTLTFLFLLYWAQARTNKKLRLIEQSKELYLALPLLLLAVLLSAWLQPQVELWFFGGDFKQWLYAYVTKDYDQRNSIVISFALGFMVIPFIFTMTDDALSSVPDSLRAASVALGASRWQTTWKVLLPSASPGLFAGVILGMGRAIGETMVVLMATGNTPIIDASLFNGMRTLSANIAVEIPEAPVDGSLYRVLFLSAVILFGFTFLINSIAELFRYSLRKKYAEF